MKSKITVKDGFKFGMGFYLAGVTLALSLAGLSILVLTVLGYSLK